MSIRTDMKEYQNEHEGPLEPRRMYIRINMKVHENRQKALSELVEYF